MQFRVERLPRLQDAIENVDWLAHATTDGHLDAVTAEHFIDLRKSRAACTTALDRFTQSFSPIIDVIFQSFF
jgi:hypothetical protein